MGCREWSQSACFPRHLLGSYEPQNSFSFPLRPSHSTPSRFLMLHSFCARAQLTHQPLWPAIRLRSLCMKTVPSGCSGYTVQNLPGLAHAGCGTYFGFGHSSCRQTLFSLSGRLGLSEGVRKRSRGGWKHVVHLRRLLWLWGTALAWPTQHVLPR